MVKAIRFEKPGASDVLQLVDIELPPPAAGQVRMKHTAIGVNFIDTYHRTGLYPLPLPSGLGSEAAGVIEAVGEGVTGFKTGDRVGYASGVIGSYAQAINAPADRLVKLPDSISDEVAAAILLKGMTAQYLLRRIHPVKAGETIVFHAAAGGVGQIGVQWAKSLGATVIGTTTSPDKVALCKANGCDHVLNSHDAGWEKQVREITGGKGVPVVYDSIGKATFLAGLDCLQPRGIMVTYGNASGPVDPFAPSILAGKGSLFVTRPTLAHYTRTPQELQETADDLFAVVASGAVKIAINQRYALKDAARAQDDLTSKKTTGATIFDAMTAERLTAIYHIRDSADRVDARATGIAVEQSVEMPVAAITDRGVLDDIVGKVESVHDLGDGSFEARIGLSVATTGLEAGQLVNMLFGNSSMHPDITLVDAEFPDSVLEAFGGPNHGIDGLRRMAGAGKRALTCSALKPQGLPPEGLAKIAAQMAQGGLDFIKDDHGIADQAYSPFAQRVPRIADAVAATGNPTVYLPSLSGHLEQMRTQIKICRAAGVKGVLVAPMIAGVSTFHALVRENPDFAFMGHPALTGPGYIAPPFLFGKLLRLFGADAVVFANHGGRFGYTPGTCKALAVTALGPLGGLKPAIPVPAGGMTLARVAEMLQFYGQNVMLLIGGDLLSAGDRMAQEAAKFQAAVVEAA